MSIIDDQISQAEALVGESRFSEAVGAFQQAIDTALDQNALNSAAHCYARLSWTAWQSGMAGQAAQFCDEGIKRLADAPSSPEMAALYQEAARAQAYAGSPSRARPLAKRALELSRQFDLKSVQAEALNTLSMASWGVEKPDDLIAMAREAVALTDAVGNKLGGARAHNNLGTALGGKMGRFREAHFHFKRSVEINKELDFKIGMLFGMANAANMSLFLGEMKEARKQIKVLEEVHASLQNHGVAGFVVSLNDARYKRQEGKLEEAYNALATLYREAYDAQDSQEMAESLTWLADIAYEIGRLDEVLPLLEAAPNESVNPIYLILGRSYLALAYAQRGLWDETHVALKRGAELTYSIPGTWAELWLKLADARICMMQGRTVDALAQYEDLSDDLMRREMHWKRAHLRFERAEAAVAAGRQSHANYLLREALGEFNKMGIEHYARQAQARLKELSDS